MDFDVALGPTLHDSLTAQGYGVVARGYSYADAVSAAAQAGADLIVLRVDRPRELEAHGLAERMSRELGIPAVLVYPPGVSTLHGHDDGPIPWLREPVDERALKYAVEWAVCRHRNEARARAEHERIVGLGTASPGMIYTFKIMPDGTSSIPYASSASRDLYGLDPEDIRDDPGLILARIHPEDLARVQESVERSRREMTPWQCTYRVAHPRKGELWLEGNSVPRLETDGSVVWHGVISDVTDRKRAEAALVLSEARFRTVVESTPDAVFVQTRGVFSYLNPAALALFGVSRTDQLVGESVVEHFHPECRVQVAERIQRLNTLKIPAPPARERILRADGSTAEVEVLAVPYSHEGETGALVFAHDITERTQREAALRANKERLKLALRAAHMGVWEWDLARNAITWSPEVYSMVGVDHFEGSAQAFLRMVHVDDAPELMERVRAALEGKTTFSAEYRVVRPDGRTIWVLSIGSETGDKPGRLVGINQDITERKHAEEERAKLKAQLLQSQKMESVGRLAGGVAHDFNNMLSVIVGHSELALLDAEPGSSLHDDLQEILAAANRSADLTRQLLAYARKQTISPRVLDLNEAVDSTIKMLRRLMGEEITLVWIPGDDLWKVNMDPSQIDQILANLAVNARDAITGAGVVTLETGNVPEGSPVPTNSGGGGGDYVMLRVRDTGAGMTKEVQDRLFEPFFTTKETGKGTGLGLATVYGIIRQNRGMISVESEAGQGTTFTMFLPRTLDAFIDNAGEVVPAIHRGSETILFVEDESAILNIGKQMLESLGYSVLATVSPIDALHLARISPTPIDLLITDVIMPEMNGRELVETLTATNPGMRHMFMSGYTADVIAESGVLDGGVAFLHKPFSMKTLAEAVRQALGGRAEG